MTIERPKPIAQQVKDILRSRIVEGHYPSDARMPSESDLASEFGVSRSTVRGALAQLAAEKLIIRRPGDGTYIDQAALQFRMSTGRLWEFSNLIEASGRKASLRSISFERRPATEREIGKLQLQPGGEVLAITNLVLADDKPSTLVCNVFPVHLLLREAIDLQMAQVPLDEFMRCHCSAVPAYAAVELSAVVAGDEVAKVLDLQAGMPLLRIDVVFFDKASCPVADTQSYYCDRPYSIRIPTGME